MESHDLLEAVQLREWRSRLTAGVVALFLFEAITGLLVYFGPFTVSSQVMVLLHVGLGILFVVPYAVYQLRHWLTQRERPLNQHKFLGYLSLVVLLIVVLSGAVLTWQAGLASRISYAWDLIHVLSGFAATAFVLWHVGIILGRHRRQTDPEKARRMRAAQGTFAGRVTVAVFVFFALTFVVAAALPTMPLVRDFPADYQLPFGDSPFAPSLATTSTGGALDPSSLAASERCGTANCHTEIVAEWLPSTHRYSSMSPFFQGVQAAMAANNGPESTRYCGGCHDPVALFSGSKNLYSDDLSGIGYREGVSCVVCHSIERTDVRGNANYVIAPQGRYLWEDSESAVAAWLGRFLIRSYPRQHLESWTRDLQKTPEFCAACHKQFIDEEINNVGWVQLQNQFDNWKQSRWHVPDDPDRTITCRECHMRLIDSLDPAAGDSIDPRRRPDDGKHRSHRFIGANQFLPALLDLPGADEQVRQTEAWLRGEAEIPEIAHKWTSGPAIPLQIIAPESVRAGEQVRVQVVALNNKPGHDFPTGPLDIIQAWIDLEVRDSAGRLVFRSGELDENGFLPSGTTVFKAEAIDQFGNLIDKHNLWEMVGARFKRTLFPGYSDVTTYAFFCPDLVPGLRSTSPQNDARTPPEPAAGRTPPSGDRRGGAGAAPPARATSEATAGGDLPPAMPMTEIEVVATDGIGELVIVARLNYRKVDQYLVNFLFPDRDLTAPVTEMSRAVARVRVERRN